MEPLKNLQAIVLDWAGTMIDHGSRAPAIVFQTIFRDQGIEISLEQAREPMGMAKREHIATIAEMSEIRQQWIERFGSECSDEDVERMYQQFLPLQKQTLTDYSDLIEGAAEAAVLCRKLGLRVGSTTGYTQELMDVVSPAAAKQGYEPELVLCAEDAPRGRPAPYLLFKTAIHFDIYPMNRIVKVDDTVKGIEAGENAGCWNIGITRTGNLMGLSVDDVNTLSDSELQSRISNIEKKLIDSGAHLTIQSVADIGPALQIIDSAIAKGLTPESAGCLNGSML